MVAMFENFRKPSQFQRAADRLARTFFYRRMPFEVEDFRVKNAWRLAMFRELSILLTVLCVTPTGLAADSSMAWKLGGTEPGDYSIMSDTSVTFAGKTSTRIASRSRSPEGFGVLSRSVVGDGLEPLKGKRVRFSANLQSERVAGVAALWMRVEGADKRRLAFDSMAGSRPIRGTTSQQRHAIVVDVPESAATLVFGVTLTGRGEVWVDRGRLDVVEESVPTTGRWSSGMSRGVSGIVKNEQGKLVDGATVVLTTKVFGPFQWKTFEAKTMNGVFQIPNAFPYRTRSQMLVTVYADGYVMTSEFIENRDGLDISERSFSLQLGTEKTFLFRDEKGRPLAGATIVPTHRIAFDGTRHQMYNQATLAADVVTDDEGKCTLSRFTEGDEVKFMLRAGGFPTATVTIDSESRQEVVVPGGLVAG